MEPVRTSAVVTAASPASVGARYGLLLGLVSVVVSFFSFSMNLQENWGIRVLSFVVIVGGIVLAQREFKKQNGGYMSYGEGLMVALVAGCLLGVLSAIFTYVYMGIIAPETVQAMMDKARAQMEAKGNLSDEQIDQAMAMSSRFMTPLFLTVGTLVGSVIYALIIGLISSAVVKNAKPEFE